MGSNVILHSILKNGGTLYIDDGRPLPQLFHKTVADLKEISPTAMFNMPAGYNLFVCNRERPRSWRQRVQADGPIELCRGCNPQGTLEKLYRLTSSITGRRIPVMSGYGATKRPRQSVRPIGRRTSRERLDFPRRACS
jgi:feruloyl-CoA synthase